MTQLAKRTQSLEYVPKENRERKGAIVDRALQKIYRKHKSVTAELVLREATDEEHPLHRYFVWDDQLAAHRYRLTQAYAMILSSKFVVQLVESGKADQKTVTETVQVRRLVNVFRGEGFQLRTDALANAQSRQAIIEAKKAQLHGWCESVADISELTELRQKVLASL